MKKIITGITFLIIMTGFLLPGTVAVQSPNGGEEWVLNTQQEIRWTAIGTSGSFRIVLFRNGVKVGRIVRDLDPSTRSYTWTVGQHEGGFADVGDGFRIRVVEQGDGGARDDSNADFSILRVARLKPAMKLAGKCDYAVETLTFLDYQGRQIMKVNNDLLFPYNGVSTPL